MNPKRTFAALALILLAGLVLYFAFVRRDTPEGPILTALPDLWVTTVPGAEPGSTAAKEESTSAAPTTSKAATTTKATTKSSTTKTTTTKTSGEAAYAFAGAYEGIEPAITAVTDPYLILVNRHYALPAGYQPALAVCVPVYAEKREMERTAAAQYKKMYDAALKDGAELIPYSGYRSTQRQKDNFDRLIRTNMDRGLTRVQAINIAAQSIMPPNCSEHEAGLAMDITRPGVWDVRDDFKGTKEYKWLSDHAFEFGFILRYPAHKADITLVQSEPWHWRYVGIEHATKMRDSGQCLEEYLGRY